MGCYGRHSLLLRIALVGWFTLPSGAKVFAELVGRTHIATITEWSISGEGLNLSRVHTPTINDRGEFSFYGHPFVSPQSMPLRHFLGDSRSIQEVPIVAVSTSDGERLFTSFFPIDPSISLVGPPLIESGSFAFPAASRIAGTTDPAVRGIYRYDTEPVELMRVGQLAPDGINSFTQFSNFVLNDAGNIAYIGVLTGGDSYGFSNTGIYRSGSDGIIEIVRAD